MEKGVTRRLVWIGIFAIAMAFVETMIVFYLRKLYYPNNILFPLNMSMPSQILFLELFREACTLIMLAAIAILAGKIAKEKFAYFIYAFAIWDIFYYIWLKLTLDWPASLMTWDVLFLIPITWASPMVCPMIVSLTMILGALIFLYLPKHRFTKKQIWLLSFGGLLIYTSFIWNYTTLYLKKAFILKFSERMLGEEIIASTAAYTPDYFNWPLFVLGEILVLLGIYIYYKRK
ncbi:MAG: hypothetical protein WCX73_04745 [Candidatus Pacearchaeota archaeon]|jgi:hypothetical protein